MYPIPQNLQSGSITVGTTPVQLTSVLPQVFTLSHSVCIIKALSTNTGIVYIGPSNVTANSTNATDGLELIASEGVAIPIGAANKIYAVASAADQKVTFLITY